MMRANGSGCRTNFLPPPAATAAKLKKGPEKKNNPAAASAADVANASGRGLEHTNLPSTRAAGEFTQACDGCDSDEIKKKARKN